MAVEEKRGCGYRKVGGLYLVGGYISVPCDRLPYKLERCPTCGAGVHFTRGLTEINPLELFGPHDPEIEVFSPWTEICVDKYRPCFMCDPTDKPAYIMFVGEKYYPTTDDFIREGNRLGISKRLPNDNLPRNLVLGETVIYLAHNRACEVKDEEGAVNGILPLFDNEVEQQANLLVSEKKTHHLGIFSAFIPKAIEKLYWQSELDKMAEKDKQKLIDKGITPVEIPDFEMDHA